MSPLRAKGDVVGWFFKEFPMTVASAARFGVSGLPVLRHRDKLSRYRGHHADENLQNKPVSTPKKVGRENVRLHLLAGVPLFSFGRRGCIQRRVMFD